MILQTRHTGVNGTTGIWLPTFQSSTQVVLTVKILPLANMNQAYFDFNLVVTMNGNCQRLRSVSGVIPLHGEQ
jgi:hypothetical protein